MYYLLNLRVQLQERRNRLFKSGYSTYHAELRYLFQFLHKNPCTRSLLTSLDSEVTLNVDDWYAECVSARHAVFPPTESGRAKVCSEILKLLDVDNSRNAVFRWAGLFTTETKLDPILRDLTEAVVDPLVNYLHDRIDDASNVLYMIERFKLKSEWFRKKELYSLYAADTRLGEANLDRELRLSLFEGGIDYPFSQPVSPSGKADVVSLSDAEDPLVLEVKVFDPDRGRGKDHIRQGLHQVLKYSNDYNKNVGFLIVYNCSSTPLMIAPDTEAKGEIPSRIEYGGRNFFVVTVNVNPETTAASREDPKSRIIITAGDLTAQQEEGT